MENKFLDILCNNFLKIHFHETLISLIFTGIFYCFTPQNFILLTKLGKLFYVGLVFITCFRFIYHLKKKKNDKKLEKEQNEKKQYITHKQLEEQLNCAWNDVAKCSVPEKKILKYLLKSNNTGINLPQNSCGYDFYNLRMFIEKTEDESDGTVRYFDINESKESDIISIGTIYIKYKLKYPYYVLLKYSQEHCGRISNFE